MTNFLLEVHPNKENQFILSNKCNNQFLTIKIGTLKEIKDFINNLQGDLIVGLNELKDFINDTLYISEGNNIYSKRDLEVSYYELKASGDTEAETFKDYLKNCMSEENGCLEYLE